MIKTGVFLLLMMGLSLSHIAFAMMPPNEIAQMNLEAEIIVLGRVTETGRILASDNTLGTNPTKGLFVAEVLHVVKGYSRVKRRDRINVIFRLPEQSEIEGSEVIEQGGASVDVEVGVLVVLYLDSSQQTDCYKPKLSGASVAVIR
jgi:hypothetical protein